MSKIIKGLPWSPNGWESALPMPETQVQSLVQEATTCREQLSPCTTTTEPILKPTSPRAHMLQLLSLCA